jgi:hypothetical protein
MRLFVATKIEPLLLVTHCYQCSNRVKLTPDHEIPLAIGLLKGISWVSSHYNSGSMLINEMSSNDLNIIYLWRKNRAFFTGYTLLPV